MFDSWAILFNFFSWLILHRWCKLYSSENKTSLRHLRIRYVRYLQGNLTENNTNTLIKSLGKTCNRSLNKMSTSDVSKTSFKNIFKMDFFNSRKRYFSFYFYLLNFCVLILMLRSCLWSESCYNIKFTTSLLRPKTNVATTLCFRRWFWDQVSMLQKRRIFEVVFLTKI